MRHTDSRPFAAYRISGESEDRRMAKKRIKSVHFRGETCSYCRGKGKVFALWDDRCKACGGSGSVLVAQPGRECSSCRGSGRRFALWDDRCKVCGGTGWAKVLNQGQYLLIIQ
ncbi:MAG: hypothetical protein GY801_10865 [bacterium]|nr:hypothetical protein [bacterium]